MHSSAAADATRRLDHPMGPHGWQLPVAVATAAGIERGDHGVRAREDPALFDRISTGQTQTPTESEEDRFLRRLAEGPEMPPGTTEQARAAARAAANQVGGRWAAANQEIRTQPPLQTTAGQEGAEAARRAANSASSASARLRSLADAASASARETSPTGVLPTPW